MGNLVESFDMTICGLLSVYLAKYLMGDSNQGLTIVFFIFFAGYLSRPLGAMTLGLFSDAYGRKITLAASILSMGIATTLVGFIPPNSSIGTGAIICLLILRIIQSFCCGAEYLNSTAYLIENAEASCKGSSCSWASFGIIAGMLAASLVALEVSHLIKIYPELEWIIWRVPFFLALLGSSIGLYVRLFIPESLEFVMYYSDHPKPKFTHLFSQSFQYLRSHKMKCLDIFALSCLGVTTTFQIYVYGPTQAHLYGNFSDNRIAVSNIISLILLLCLVPLFGKLSDYVNREKILVGASIGFLILSPPYFYMLSYGSYSALIWSQCLLSIAAAAYYGTVPVMLTEMFPLNLRCTSVSLLFSTAASLSAGLTPLLSLILLKKTDNAIAPTLLIVVLVMFTLTVMWVKNRRKDNISMDLTLANDNLL
jgi:MHS family proline/betaine transporter-like MFS transporter